jgi:hypothetical protein
LRIALAVLAHSDRRLLLFSAVAMTSAAQRWYAPLTVKDAHGQSDSSAARNAARARWSERVDGPVRHASWASAVPAEVTRSTIAMSECRIDSPY